MTKESERSIAVEANLDTLPVIKIFRKTVPQAGSAQILVSDSNFHAPAILEKLVPVPVPKDSVAKRIVQRSLKEYERKLSNNLISQSLVTNTLSKSRLAEQARGLKESLKRPFKLDNLSATYNRSYNDFVVDSNNFRNIHDLQLTTNFSILSIPAQLNYLYQDYPVQSLPGANVFSLRYDRDGYISGLSRKLREKLKPEEFLPQNIDPVEILKSSAEAALRSELEELKAKYNGLFNDKLQQLGSLKDLFHKDMGSLRQQLLNPEWLETIHQKTEYLNQLQTAASSGRLTNREELGKLKAELEKFRGVNELMAKLESHKNKWEQSGLLKRIVQSDLLREQQLKQIASDPSVVSRMAKQKLDLNGIQKLFLKMSKLNLGESTPALSSLSVGNTLFHGLHSGLAINNKSLDILAGGQRTFNSIQDLPFTNAIFPADNKLAGFSFGSGAATGNQTSFSFLSAQSRAGSGLPLSAIPLPRMAKVFTLGKHIELDSKNKIDLELSKSTGGYINELGTDSANVDKTLNDLLGNGDFLSNSAISVQYSGHQHKINLDNEVYIKFAGNSYSNPAASFVPAGTKEAGTNLRKLFLKNKLQVMVRTNWREYTFGNLNGNRWRNRSYFADVKWKMRRGQSLSLRYQPIGSYRILDGKKNVQAATERLSANAVVAKKLGRIQYRNNLNLAYQQNKFLLNSFLNTNTSLQVASLQNVVIGRRLFFSNTAYNMTDNPSGFVFFNTSFNSDWGISYTIGKAISASSSVNYQSVRKWYQQAALKQTLSGQIGNNLSIYMYIDVGKNLKVFQAIPNNTVRTECSIQYLFNQK